MTIELYDEINISENFVCGIEYYDLSSLDEKEVEQLDEFLEQYKNCYFEYSQETFFARCEICNLMSNCVTVKIFKESGK